MVLESDESFRAAHFCVPIDERGKMDAVDFLDEPVTLGDDLHRIPIVFLVLRLYLGGVSELRVRSRAILFDDGLFTRSAHEEAGLSLRVRLVEKGVVPEAHDVSLGDFNLVSEDLPLAEIVAADLDAGVALVPAKFKAKSKVRGLAAAPDKPVFFFGGARTPDLAVTDFPGARFAVPAREIAAVENGNEAGFVIRRVDDCERILTNDMEGVLRSEVSLQSFVFEN